MRAFPYDVTNLVFPHIFEPIQILLCQIRLRANSENVSVTCNAGNLCLSRSCKMSRNRSWWRPKIPGSFVPGPAVALTIIPWTGPGGGDRLTEATSNTGRPFSATDRIQRRPETLPAGSRGLDFVSWSSSRHGVAPASWRVLLVLEMLETVRSPQRDVHDHMFRAAN